MRDARRRGALAAPAPARREASLTKVIDEFAWRLTAAGIGLLRVGAQHLDAASAISRRDLSVVEGRRRDPQDDDQARSARRRALRDNPVLQTRAEKKIIRRRLEGDPARVRLLRARRSQGARRHRLSEPAGRKPVRLRERMSSPTSPTRSAASARRRSTCSPASRRTSPSSPTCAASGRSPRTCSPPISARRPGRGCWPGKSGAAAASRCARRSGRPTCAASPPSPITRRAPASSPCSTNCSSCNRRRSRRMAARS